MYQIHSTNMRQVQLGKISYGKIFVFGGRMYVKVIAPRITAQGYVPCVPVGTINNNGIQYFHWGSLVEV